MEKGLKLKVRKFLGLIRTFVEVIGRKLLGGYFVPSPPHILNWVKVCLDLYSKTNFVEDFYYILSYTINFLLIHVA